MSRVNRSSLSSSNQDLAVLGANGQMLNNGSHVPISNSGTRILGSVNFLISLKFAGLYISDVSSLKLL